jgi:hypothetical protein
LETYLELVFPIAIHRQPTAGFLCIFPKIQWLDQANTALFLSKAGRSILRSIPECDFPKEHGFKKNINWNSLNSITELFLNANWLEREISELHGIFFLGKKDLRNLMLPYGDTSSPMRKSFPSIGIKEIFYDSTTDLLIQTPVSLQF